MVSRPTVRNTHAWWSVILALPVFVVSLTAILLAHEDGLGLKTTAASSAMRSLFSERAAATMPEVRGSVRHSDGNHYVGTKSGVLAKGAGGFQPVTELAGLDVRALASLGPNLWAATKSGVWLKQGTWTRVLKTDAWSIHSHDDGRIAIGTKDSGFLLTADDGRSWQTDSALNADLAGYAASAGAPPITWQKLVLDMHTGRAFVGKEYEWLWIDLIGGTLLFLTVSGFIMWWRSHRRMLLLKSTRPSGRQTAHLLPGE